MLEFKSTDEWYQRAGESESELERSEAWFKENYSQNPEAKQYATQEDLDRVSETILERYKDALENLAKR